jgi:hypothetical protein
VADVDRDSLAFGPAGAAPRAPGPAERDVDRDGHADLVLHVRLSDTGLEAGDSSACLSGVVLGDTFEACAAVAAEEPGRRR